MIAKESIIKQLRERGLKITPQRLAIIEVLVEQGDLHPGARLVYEFEPIDRLCDAQRAFSPWHHQNASV
jgi:hypothetical protein